MDKRLKHYADGKTRSRTDKIKEIEKAYGINRISPFGTGNREVFEEILADLDLQGLVALAQKCKVPKAADLKVQADLLRKAFAEYVRTRGDSVGDLVDKQTVIEPNKPASGKAKEIYDRNLPKTILQKDFPDIEEPEQFEHLLGTLRLVELRNLAAKLGYNPSFDKGRLVTLLVNAFKEDKNNRIGVK